MFSNIKTARKRIISIVTTLIMVAALMPITLSSSLETSSAATLNNPRVTDEKSTWDCVYFGSYPQTEIVANASQCGTTGKHFAQSSDYEVNANLYGRLKNASYDANGDTVIDGVKYKELKKGQSSFKHFTVLDNQRPDYYAFEEEDIHYFRYDKIKWRVLENKDGYALLLSDLILDNHRWHIRRNEHVLWGGVL